jgi:hypothetical protein
MEVKQLGVISASVLLPIAVAGMHPEVLPQPPTGQGINS